MLDFGVLKAQIDEMAVERVVRRDSATPPHDSFVWPKRRTPPMSPSTR